MSVKKTINLLEGKCYPVGGKIEGGQIFPALAPVKVAGKVPDGTIFVGHAEGAGRFFACTKSAVYVSVNCVNFFELEQLGGSFPFLVEDIADGKPRAVLVNGGGAIWHDGKSYKYYFYGGNLTCGVMHCGRLFGADAEQKNKLCWSGSGGVEDWGSGLNASGSTVLDPERGDILDLTEFNGKLTAVRKYGITVLNMYGSPENFSVGITDTDTEEIIRGTARVAGGKLLFYTASGLCAFDGSKITSVAHRFTGDIYGPVCSVALGNTYFLSCKSKREGGAVFCYDAEDGESYLVGISADVLCTAAGQVYAYNSEGAFRLEKGGYTLTVSGVDFGTAGYKTVTKTRVSGRADLEITSGTVCRRFRGADGEFRPRLRGKSFDFKLSGDAPVRLLTAEAEVADGI